MRIQWWWVVLLSVAGLAVGPGPGRAEDKTDQDVKALAARIDQFIAAQWTEKGAKPAALASDPEFLRRVYLDLAGRIPRVSEVRDFLDDTSADKRQQLVRRLLDGPGYVSHFTNVYRALILPPSNNQQFQFLTPSFESWLRDRLQQNVGYDQMVRELLTASPTGGNPYARQRLVVSASTATPVAFYQVNEYKPENLAASTTRLFMGMRLECAQCHDHPFAKWTREQFWETAALFTGLMPQARVPQPRGPVLPAGKLRIPGTEKEVKARFLDGTEPKASSRRNYRQQLADWLTRADNPYFARATANRLWAHLFGIGLIDPVDEPGDDNPPSHPELLDELARQFVAHKFDVKFMIRAITASRAYQLSSVCSHPTQNEPRLFARMAVKGLTPEQLFDSLALATGYREPTGPNQPRFAVIAANSPRGQFLAQFSSQDRRTEFQTSILQALALMNGRFIADATSLDRSETLAAVVDSPFLDTAEKQLEALYLAALSRKPRPAELSRLVRYVQGGGPRKNPKTALTDVFWALLNSSEFILNH
jgi:hypothetical protein